MYMYIYMCLHPRGKNKTQKSKKSGEEEERTRLHGEVVVNVSSRTGRTESNGGMRMYVSACECVEEGGWEQRCGEDEMKERAWCRHTRIHMHIHIPVIREPPALQLHHPTSITKTPTCASVSVGQGRTYTLPRKREGVGWGTTLIKDKGIKKGARAQTRFTHPHTTTRLMRKSRRKTNPNGEGGGG